MRRNDSQLRIYNSMLQDKHGRLYMLSSFSGLDMFLDAVCDVVWIGKPKSL